MQSRGGSVVESLTNTGVGFVLSLLVWQFIVVPVWDLKTNFISNLNIILLFTVISILRGYVLRRLFNWHHKNNKNANDKHQGNRAAHA